MDNAIGINVEGDLNLGHASGRGGDTHQLKLAQGLVVCCHFTLTLEDLDAHLGLVVCCCAEGLGLLGGNGCVSAHHAAVSDMGGGVVLGGRGGVMVPGAAQSKVPVAEAW